MSEMDNRVGAYVMLGKRAVTRIMVVIRTVYYLPCTCGKVVMDKAHSSATVVMYSACIRYYVSSECRERGDLTILWVRHVWCVNLSNDLSNDLSNEYPGRYG